MARIWLGLMVFSCVGHAGAQLFSPLPERDVEIHQSYVMAQPVAAAVSRYASLRAKADQALPAPQFVSRSDILQLNLAPEALRSILDRDDQDTDLAILAFNDVYCRVRTRSFHQTTQNHYLWSGACEPNALDTLSITFVVDAEGHTQVTGGLSKALRRYYIRSIPGEDNVVVIHEPDHAAVRKHREDFPPTAFFGADDH